MIQSLTTWLATLALLCLLGAVAVVDARSKRIPDWLNAIFICAGLYVTWILGRSILDALIGVIVGYGALFLLNEGFRRVRGRDGIGMGDAKFLAGAGAWLGWRGLPFVLLFAALFGLAYVGLRAAFGRKLERADELPFGPALAGATFVVWCVLFLVASSL